MKKGIVLVDTMYLSVRYPKSDIYKRWSKHAIGCDPRQLRTGIPVKDFVIRPGASGYAISLWHHDARIFLTPETDDIRGQGNGMGIWVQLGPKFLIDHITDIQTAVGELLSKVGIRKKYETRITRLDIAIDLFNINMKEQNPNLWRSGWVGRSKVSSNYFNSRTGEFETINIGSRESAVYVRVYDKLVQAINEGDIYFWLDVWQEKIKSVTRIEWEVKQREGNFSEALQDFYKFNGFAIRELMIYLLDWGRLCIPNCTDTNRNRWEETDFWKNLREFVSDWAQGVTWPTSRYGKEYKPVSERYIRQLSGTIVGGMARLSDSDPSLASMLDGMAEYGEDYETIKKRANAKRDVINNL